MDGKQALLIIAAMFAIQYLLETHQFEPRAYNFSDLNVTTPHDYESGVYDCKNFSAEAYVELNDRGISTAIVVANTSHTQNGSYHAFNAIFYEPQTQTSIDYTIDQITLLYVNDRWFTVEPVDFVIMRENDR